LVEKSTTKLTVPLAARLDDALTFPVVCRLTDGSALSDMILYLERIDVP
jgi:hypothetical protein